VELLKRCSVIEKIVYSSLSVDLVFLNGKRNLPLNQWWFAITGKEWKKMIDLHLFASAFSILKASFKIEART
jgi:hypothetical protein